MFHLLITLMIENRTYKDYVFWAASNIKYIKKLPLFIRSHIPIKDAYEKYGWLCNRGELRMTAEREAYIFRNIG